MIYTIIAATDYKSLYQQINDMAADGWECIGGVAVSVVLSGERFYQLMGRKLKRGRKS